MGTFMSGQYIRQPVHSMDPEKIIKVWEGDTFKYINGKVVKMRACDHKMILDLGLTEYVPPDQQKISINIPPITGLKALLTQVRSIEYPPPRSFL